LPPVLGKTHPRWQSPRTFASIAASVLSLVIIGLFAIFRGQLTTPSSSQAYGQLYGLMAVMGVIIILSVPGARLPWRSSSTTCAHHRDEVHWWKTLLAPVLAFISQGYVRVPPVSRNLDFLGAGSYGYAKLVRPRSTWR